MKKHIIAALAITLVFILVIPVACPRGAQFELSALVISPAEVISGEEVTVTAEVSNSGGVAGTYTATLKLDGVEVETKEVTVAAEGTEMVVFTVTEDTPGTYQIELGELSGTLEVMERRVEFELGALDISPAEIASGGKATITAEVSNTGNVEGTYIATLKINGVEEETREVTVAAEGTEMVVFRITEYTPGTHQVEMDGLSSTFEVMERLVEFESKPCLFVVPAGQTVECGYLTVPEARSWPDGSTIRLYVAIFRSQSANPAPDPVVYLAGGPGGTAIESVALTFNERYAPFLADRDFIVFDQRGTSPTCSAIIRWTETRAGWRTWARRRRRTATGAIPSRSSRTIAAGWWSARTGSSTTASRAGRPVWP